MSDNILDEQQFGYSALRRRDLLPLWIKIFIWIFLIFGTILPVILILGIIGINFNLSLYGLETTQPLSLIGLLITILFALKGIVAFGLWMEKEWAIKMVDFGERGDVHLQSVDTKALQQRNKML